MMEIAHQQRQKLAAQSVPSNWVPMPLTTLDAALIVGLLKFELLLNLRLKPLIAFELSKQERPYIYIYNMCNFIFNELVASTLLDFIV